MNDKAKIVAGLYGVRQRLENRIKGALAEYGQLILTESNKRVPRETTALERDGHVRIDGNGFDTVVTVGYGTYGARYWGLDNRGKNVIKQPEFYAVFVHFDLKKHHPIGEAYFLQRAIDFTITTGRDLIYKRMMS